MSQDTLTRLYAAFAALDAPAMAACYADQATFDDEVFSLQGRESIGAMWAMLCEAARAQGPAHWRLEASALSGQGSQGSAHWEAHYVFSATGRAVHNIIEAHFVFNEAGLIRRHRDRFDFWRWARQALGAPGWLLGWSPMLRNKVRNQAAAGLRRFMDRR